MLQIFRARIQKIIKVFGIKNGIRYMFIYFLHKHCYIKLIGKRIVRLTYKGKDIYVRMFSRDLDFVESILIGNYIRGKLVGEYDLRGRGEEECCEIIDLGANIGLYSLLCALKNPKKKIIALEPEYENYLLLKKNMMSFENVICLNMAAWYRETSLKLCKGSTIIPHSNTPSEGGFYVRECQEDEKERISGITIDKLVNNYGLSNYLVKMDIEGSEYSIFMKGSIDWLKQCRILIIEMHNRFFPHQKLDKEVSKILNNTHFLREVCGENKIYRLRRNL